MQRSGILTVINQGGKVMIVAFGDSTAVADALAHAGKMNPKIANAISMAAIELDNYSEALKTGEKLRKMIEDEKEEK